MQDQVYSHVASKQDLSITSLVYCKNTYAKLSVTDDVKSVCWTCFQRHIFNSRQPLSQLLSQVFCVIYSETKMPCTLPVLFLSVCVLNQKWYTVTAWHMTNVHCYSPSQLAVVKNQLPVVKACFVDWYWRFVKLKQQVHPMSWNNIK